MARIFLLVIYNLAGAPRPCARGCLWPFYLHIVFMVQFLIGIKLYGNPLNTGYREPDAPDCKEIRDPDL